MKRHPNFIDRTGMIYGRLTVIKAFKDDLSRASGRWICRCYCGRETIVRTCHLSSGHTVSCGCARDGSSARTHGMTETPEHSIWCGIKKRCHNPNDKAFHRYGGRGIRVCDRWLNSFELFLRDMGVRPSPIHQIERIDNDGNYGPSNCRWATKLEQANNTRTNHFVEHDGKRLTLEQWSRVLGIKAPTIRRRLRIGKTPAEALTSPVRGKNNHGKNIKIQPSLG